MVLHTHRLLILVVCIGLLLLAFQPGKVSGVRGMDFIFRWNGEQEEDHQVVAVNKPRLLKEVDDVVDLNTGMPLAPAPQFFDLNRTSKRRVRRGSDPIHNRC